MTKSALQIARAAYQPKLPKALKGHVKAVAGEATQSVADQEAIQKLFPNTYGMPLIKFETSAEAVSFPVMNVGVILSGGQAPGDQEAEPRKQALRFHLGSWWLG